MKSMAVFTGICILTACADARAQSESFTERKTSSGTSVTFADDPLGALADDPIGVQIRGPLVPRRCLLMRPRVQFVSAMLRSVETM